MRQFQDFDHGKEATINETVHRKKIYIAIAAAFLLLIFGMHVFVQGSFSGIAEGLKGFVIRHTFWSPVLFFALAALSVLLGPFSSSPLAPIAVSAWGVPTTLAILLLGWVSGDLLVYIIGRFVGRRLVEKLVGRSRLASWTAFIEENMTFSLLLLFRMAAPSETGYAFGIFKYRFATFVVLSVLAELPFSILTVFASEALLDSGWFFFATLAGSWVALVAFSAAVLRRGARARARKAMSAE